MNTLNRVVQLAKVAILARLLPPAEFGILGIGFLMLAIFEHFSQLGTDTALIQRKESQIDEYLDTTWVLQIVRGGFLAVIIYFTAPVAASWFGEPRAADVLRVLGLGPLLLGLKNPGIVYFQKNLQFHRRFVQILSGTVVNFAVAVTLGVLLGNVWALVVGSIAGNVTSVVMSYRLHRYRPRLAFDLDRARELVNFGKWIFGSSIITFLTRKGDDIFVGWFLGATPLAFYQMGYRFSKAPASEFSSVINTVAFSGFSEVQSDYRKLRNGYFRTLRLTTFLVFPTAVGIAVVAPAFVRVVLGSDWLPVIPIMQALAAYGGLRGLNATNGPIYNTLSRPDINTKLDVVQFLVIALAIYPAADRFGLLGVTAVMVGAVAITVPVKAYLVLRMINGSPLNYVRILVYPAVGSTIMGAVVWSTQSIMALESPIVELFLVVFAGVVVYTAYTGLVVMLFRYSIEAELRMIYQSFS